MDLLRYVCSSSIVVDNVEELSVCDKKREKI